MDSALDASHEVSAEARNRAATNAPAGTIASDEQQCLLRALASAPEGKAVMIGARGANTLALGAAATQELFTIAPRAARGDRNGFLGAVAEANLADRVRIVDLPHKQVARAWREPIGFLSIDEHVDHAAVLTAWREHLADQAIVALRSSDKGKGKGSKGGAGARSAGAEGELIERVGQVRVSRFDRSRPMRGGAGAGPRKAGGMSKREFQLRPESVANGVYYGNNGAYMYQPTLKCGCTSVKKLLIEFEGLPLIKEEKKRNNKKFNKFPGVGHLPREEQLKIFRGETDTFKFVFVRNPFARTYSAYSDKIVVSNNKASYIRQIRKSAEKHGIHLGDTISFADFINVISRQTITEMNPHWRPQFIGARLDLIKWDFIGRFEKMHEDLGFALKQIGAPSHIIEQASEKHNSTGSGASAASAWETVPPDVFAAFVARYERDFEEFKYERHM